MSVNKPKRLLFPPEGFSLKWYAELFTQSDWVGALSNSLIIATCASLFAVSVALPIALYVWNKNNILARILFALGVTPFMFPPVISALGFLIFWVSAGFYGHIIATIISHGVFLVTLPLVTISLGLGAIDRQHIEAAHTMGAKYRVLFLTVIMPLIKSYLITI